MVQWEHGCIALAVACYEPVSEPVQGGSSVSGVTSSQQVATAPVSGPRPALSQDDRMICLDTQHSQHRQATSKLERAHE